MNGRTIFFHQFLKEPLQIGSVVPSSRFLERRIVKTANVASANMIVELGPGTGGTTKAILAEMKPDAKLLTVEINPLFHQLVSQIKDDRLITHLGNAVELKEILESYGLPNPDVVISGIPFSTLDRSLGTKIIEVISSVLVYGGKFVAYQARNRVADLCEPVMGCCHHKKLELLNIPPMRVYCWSKNGFKRRNKVQ